MDLTWLCWSYSVKLLATFGLFYEAALLMTHILAITYTKYFMYKKPPNLMQAHVEGVSILKPLKGVDPNLESNLETFFNIDYPQYEIIFCIEDADDPAYEVVQKLLKKHPNFDCRLVTGGKKCGPNPKVNNLVPAYDTMKYNMFWMCDSRIQAHPMMLKDFVSKMTDDVALVHAVPYSLDRPGFASVLEKVNFGTQQGRVYLFANLLGFCCTTGMCMFTRKDYLEKCIGGLGKLSVYLAEDFFLAKHFRQNGYKVRLSSYSALQNCGNYGVMKFFTRMIRWTKLRLFMIPWIVAMEPISDCFVSGLFFSLSCRELFGLNMLVVFLVHVAVWFTLDYTLISLLENGRLKVSKLYYIFAWLLRETLSPYVILHVLWNPRNVIWMGGKYKLFCGGRSSEVLED